MASHFKIGLFLLTSVYIVGCGNYSANRFPSQSESVLSGGDGDKSCEENCEPTTTPPPTIEQPPPPPPANQPSAPPPAPPTMPPPTPPPPMNDPIPVAGMQLIFKSGFEGTMSITPSANGQSAKISGGDVSPFRWENFSHVFNFVAVNAFNNFVTSRIDSTRARSGAQSLYMSQNKLGSGAQNRLQFQTRDSTFGMRIFTRRYYYIPSTILQQLKAEYDDTSLAGTRETRGSGNNDFSMPLLITRQGSSLQWVQAIIDYSAGSVWSEWTRPPFGMVVRNNTDAVPLNRWFQLDIYIERHPTQGVIKVWLDGKLIFDLKNVRTKNDSDTWFTKIADIDCELKSQPSAPVELWVDDIEVWRGN